MGKPTIFVGSSSSNEAMDVAGAIQLNLQNDAEVEIWNQGVFSLSQTFISSLESAIERFDYAIFVLTGDDRVISKGRQSLAVRDNVLFELGLFMARIGRNRTFIVHDKKNDPKIPTDLLGVTLACYEKPEKTTLQAALGPACTMIRQEIKKGPRSKDLATSLSFDQIIKEYTETLERLKARGEALLQQIIKDGDLERLKDGLYSALLYASRAIVTGSVDSRFYGNLMECDKERSLLRVRHFAGPYNEEVITRQFPIEGKGEGVASKALQSGQVQIRNRMDQELKVPGEGRLQAMISIPLERIADCAQGTIAVLNVDSVREGVFPQQGSPEYIELDKRIKLIRKLFQQVNSIKP